MSQLTYTYCDFCDKLMDSPKYSLRLVNSKLPRGAGDLEINFSMTVDGKVGHMCKSCMIDAIKAGDPRRVA